MQCPVKLIKSTGFINNQKCRIMHVDPNNQKHVYRLHQNLQENDSNNTNLIVTNVQKILMYLLQII
jgi:hypothetical protein